MRATNVRIIYRYTSTSKYMLSTLYSNRYFGVTTHYSYVDDFSQISTPLRLLCASCACVHCTATSYGDECYHPQMDAVLYDRGDHSFHNSKGKIIARVSWLTRDRLFVYRFVCPQQAHIFLLKYLFLSSQNFSLYMSQYDGDDITASASTSPHAPNDHTPGMYANLRHQ